MPRHPDALLEELQLTSLPSPPALLAKVLEACGGDAIGFDELSSLFEKDTALAARVIAVANTPLYYRGGHHASIREVLMVLGLRTVRSIALAAAAFQYFSTGGLPPERGVALWRHSIMTALLARQLARLTAYGAPEEAYLSGLLHDVGRLVLALNRPQDYAPLWDEAAGGMPTPGQERERVGYRHDEVGAQVGELWGLRAFVTDAIRFHHETATALRDAHPLVRLVHLANTLAGTPPEAGGEALAAAAAGFGFTRGVLEEIRVTVEVEVAATQAAMGIDDAPAPAPAGGPLGEQLRRQALIGAVREQFQEGDGEEAIVTGVLRCSRLLFDIDAALMFEYDAGERCLRGCAGHGQNPRLNEITVPLEAGRSVLGRSLLARAATGTEAGEGKSVLDRQLARLLRRPALLCVPLFAGGEAAGVLVLGVGEAQGARLAAQGALLSAFANEVATRWSDWRRRSRQLAQAGVEVAAEHEAHCRRIAHEANNPLTIMRNYLALLGTRVGDDAAVQDDLNVLRDEIDRVAAIIAGLREGPAAGDEGGAVDVNALVRDLVKLLEGGLLTGRGLALETALDDAIPPLHTRRHALKQILLNLCRNAAEAMGEAGTLHLASRDYIYLDGTAFVELTVADDGPGMPPQVLANLFQPVTSTKGGVHAGLGLSIVKSLVDELGGKISCRSGGGGTAFQVLLPRTLEG